MTFSDEELLEITMLYGTAVAKKFSGIVVRIVKQFNDQGLEYKGKFWLAVIDNYNLFALVDRHLMVMSIRHKDINSVFDTITTNGDNVALEISNNPFFSFKAIYVD